MQDGREVCDAVAWLAKPFHLESSAVLLGLRNLIRMASTSTALWQAIQSASIQSSCIRFGFVQQLLQ